MIVYTSPRMLKDRHAVSLPCQALTGIMAGDAQANAFAKCVLYDVLAHIHGKWPGAGPFSYVDDLAQTARGFESGILQTLGPAGVCMAQKLEEAGCVISSKSVLVASNAKLGQRLVRVFCQKRHCYESRKSPTGPWSGQYCGQKALSLDGKAANYQGERAQP